MTLETAGQKLKKGEITKQKLFKTAAQLFTQYDFDYITVDKIVETAGVAKGTFYIYFESKDALIAAFLTYYVDHLDADYKAHLDSLPGDISSPDMLLSLIDKIADVLTDKIGYHMMRIAYKLQLTRDVNMNAVMGYNRRLYHMFAAVLNRGIERKEFYPTLPVDILTQHFVMAIRGISYEWCIRYPNFDLKQQALTHFKLLLDAIKRPPAY